MVAVEQGSMAEEMGIRPGDVIKEVDHEPVRTLQDYNGAMAKVGRGAPVLLLVARRNETFFVTLEPGQ